MKLLILSDIHSNLDALDAICAAWGNRDPATPRASYAVWDDGEFILRKAHYPVETTIAKLKLLSFKEPIEQELVLTLRTGETPFAIL